MKGRKTCNSDCCSPSCVMERKYSNKICYQRKFLQLSYMEIASL